MRMNDERDGGGEGKWGENVEGLIEGREEDGECGSVRLRVIKRGQSGTKLKEVRRR